MNGQKRQALSTGISSDDDANTIHFNSFDRSTVVGPIGVPWRCGVMRDPCDMSERWPEAALGQALTRMSSQSELVFVGFSVFSGHADNDIMATQGFQPTQQNR